MRRETVLIPQSPNFAETDRLSFDVVDRLQRVGVLRSQEQSGNADRRQFARTLRPAVAIRQQTGVDAGVFRIGRIDRQRHIAEILMGVDAIGELNRLSVLEPHHLQCRIALGNYAGFELCSAHLLIDRVVVKLKVQSSSKRAEFRIHSCLLIFRIYSVIVQKTSPSIANSEMNPKFCECFYIPVLLERISKPKRPSG